MTVNVKGFADLFGDDARERYEQYEDEVRDKLLKFGEEGDGGFTNERRFFVGAGFVYLTFLVVLIALYIVRLILVAYLWDSCWKPCIKKFFCGCCQKTDDFEDKSRGFSVDITLDIRVEPLSDNYKKAIKDFEDL